MVDFLSTSLGPCQKSTIFFQSTIAICGVDRLLNPRQLNLGGSDHTLLTANDGRRIDNRESQRGHSPFNVRLKCVLHVVISILQLM